MERQVAIRLGQLTFEEEFRTTITGKLGRVVEIGSTRPSGGWSSYLGKPRPRWRTVRCWLDGRTVDLSPDLIVLVSAGRMHLTAAELGDERWKTPLSEATA